MSEAMRQDFPDEKEQNQDRKKVGEPSHEPSCVGSKTRQASRPRKLFPRGERSHFAVAKTHGMSATDFIIRIEDAARMTGYSVYSIRQFAHRGEFAATMPRGRRGGWEIVKPSFEAWWQSKRASSATRK